jgi:hypothetical protein
VEFSGSDPLFSREIALNQISFSFDGEVYQLSDDVTVAISTTGLNVIIFFLLTSLLEPVFVAPALETDNQYLDVYEADSPRPWTKQQLLSTVVPSSAAQYDFLRQGPAPIFVFPDCVPAMNSAAASFSAAQIEGAYESCSIGLVLTTGNVDIHWRNSSKVCFCGLHS